MIVFIILCVTVSNLEGEIIGSFGVLFDLAPTSGLVNSLGLYLALRVGALFATSERTRTTTTNTTPAGLFLLLSSLLIDPIFGLFLACRLSLPSEPARLLGRRLVDIQQELAVGRRIGARLIGAKLVIVNYGIGRLVNFAIGPKWIVSATVDAGPDGVWQLVEVFVDGRRCAVNSDDWLLSVGLVGLLEPGRGLDDSRIVHLAHDVDFLWSNRQSDEVLCLFAPTILVDSLRALVGSTMRGRRW